MNKQDIQSSVYAQKVDLLLRLLPLVMEEKVFAVHGGTAINLFLRNLPRYSVDIDLTYIPLADRKKSIDDINFHLKSISEKALCQSYFHALEAVEHSYSTNRVYNEGNIF